MKGVSANEKGSPLGLSCGSEEDEESQKTRKVDPERLSHI